jgi:hypothetical protein
METDWAQEWRGISFRVLSDEKQQIHLNQWSRLIERLLKECHYTVEAKAKYESRAISDRAKQGLTPRSSVPYDPSFKAWYSTAQLVRTGYAVPPVLALGSQTAKISEYLVRYIRVKDDRIVRGREYAYKLFSMFPRMIPGDRGSYQR